MQVMEEFDSKYPLPMAEQDMYDMYFYDEQARQGNMPPQYYEKGQQLYDDEEEFDSDDQLTHLYTEGLAERIWEDD